MICPGYFTAFTGTFFELATGTKNCHGEKTLDADKREFGSKLMENCKGKCYNVQLVKEISTNFRGVRVEYTIITSVVKSIEMFLRGDKF